MSSHHLDVSWSQYFSYYLITTVFGRSLLIFVEKRYVNGEFDKYIVRADLFLSTSQLDSSRQQLDEQCLIKTYSLVKFDKILPVLLPTLLLGQIPEVRFLLIPTIASSIHQLWSSSFAQTFGTQHWILHNQRKVNHEGTICANLTMFLTFWILAVHNISVTIWSL